MKREKKVDKRPRQIEKLCELLEDLEDLRIVAERRNEPAVPHLEALAELKNEGFIRESS